VKRVNTGALLVAGQLLAQSHFGCSLRALCATVEIAYLKKNTTHNQLTNVLIKLSIQIRQNPDLVQCYCPTKNHIIKLYQNIHLNSTVNYRHLPSKSRMRCKSLVKTDACIGKLFDNEHIKSH